MPGSIATLDKIDADGSLYKAFAKFLNRQKLLRLYDTIKTQRDERTACAIVLEPGTAAENAFSNGTMQRMLDIYNGIFDDLRNDLNAKLAKLKTPAVLASQEGLTKKLYEKTNTHPKWKSNYNSFRVSLLQRFADLAEDEFPHSPEYVSYMRGSIDAKRISADLDIQDRLDEVMELAVAAATANAADERRLSQRLADGHQPRRGKRKNAKQMLAFIRSKLPKSPFG
ncbi:MAG: hypothetical protein AAF409_05220 [Pseudomonadota bacterium]